MNEITLSQEKARDIVLSMYIGEGCSLCGHIFNSLEDLKKRKPMCSGTDPLRIACNHCFELAHKEQIKKDD